MKKKLLTAFLLIITSRLAAQNVGIGTTNPQAPFTVAAGKTVLFGNDTLGSGTKMMWIPAKAAFRAGEVFTNNYWNTDSIGLHSFAAGRNTKAKGSYSFAFGNSSIASGIGSIAMGVSSTASGDSSVAMGYATTASGDYSTVIGSRDTASGSRSLAAGFLTNASGASSTAIGYNTTASGTYSTAMGNFTTASGPSSTATGSNTTASGNTSTAMGYVTTASGNYSNATGFFTTARAYISLALGRFNDSIGNSSPTSWVATDPVLIIGNGTDGANRSNALVIYKNGNADLNGFVRIGEISDGAPRIKTKKLTGTTPSSANPNTWTFVPHGLANASKILSISVLVTDGSYQFLPHSPDAGLLYTVNTAPDNGGSIAVGVKSVAQSSSVMGKPIKILITYEE